MSATLEKIDVSWVEKTPELTDQQTGALRRILNLSSRLTGDWSGMMGFDVAGGEDFGAFRFQLAYMSYALALAHVHRMPAAPGVFKKPFERLIQKILLPDCWLYWSNASTGNGPLNSGLGELPRQWDPVAKDNIMYSAYVQSMALMYHYIFRDDRFAKPEALTFELKTKYWHTGGFRFPYDENSLSDAIYWQMVEQGFLGVACEPNCVFQICNQPPLIGFRMHDLVYGGDRAGEASRSYLEAWKEFGVLDAEGNFHTLVLVDSRSVIATDEASLNFWLMSLMHSWNPKLVEQQYPVLLQRKLLDGPDGTKWIMPKASPFDEPGGQLNVHAMSWTACCASELGDTETLNGLFSYADRFMNPVWEDGAYYYKRRDENFNEDGLFVGMDVASGNAMFSYARLNVKDGLKKLYDGPLTDAHFEQPALIGLPDDLDVRRACYDVERDALALTLGTLPAARDINLEIRVPRGRELPVVLKDGVVLERGIRRTDAGLTLHLHHGPRATLVLQW